MLVPLYDTPRPLLREMLESVLNQVYPHWELCLADDASPSPHVREIVEGYMAQDPRIKCVFRPRNGHISEASNSALELATEAEWLALLDHDDVLTPDALLAIAGEIAAHPDAQFIYSDEDKLDEKGVRNTPFFKPDFSPELLRAPELPQPPVGAPHRQSPRRAAAGGRATRAARDYDLNLRTLERLPPDAVRHIPRVLYHWRAVAGSTALAVGEKSYAVEAGAQSAARTRRPHGVGRRGQHGSGPALLPSALRRARPRAAGVGDHPHPATAPTSWAPASTRCWPTPTTPAFEIVIADNGSVEPATFALFARLTQDPRVRVVQTPGPFNYSRINNQTVGETRGELVCPPEQRHRGHHPRLAERDGRLGPAAPGSAASAPSSTTPTTRSSTRG